MGTCVVSLEDQAVSTGLGTCQCRREYQGEACHLCQDGYFEHSDPDGRLCRSYSPDADAGGFDFRNPFTWPADATPGNGVCEQGESVQTSEGDCVESDDCSIASPDASRDNFGPVGNESLVRTRAAPMRAV